MITFYYTIPMIVLQIMFFIMLVYYTCTRSTAFMKANAISKLQFILLYLLCFVQTVQLVLYNIA